MGRVILQKVNAGFRVHIDIEHSKTTIKIPLEGETHIWVIYKMFARSGNFFIMGEAQKIL